MRATTLCYGKPAFGQPPALDLKIGRPGARRRTATSPRDDRAGSGGGEWVEPSVTVLSRPCHRRRRELAIIALPALDPETSQRSLLFEIDYPEIEVGLQPRHRFMSAFEQRVEAPDKAWQYLLFAAEPRDGRVQDPQPRDRQGPRQVPDDVWNDENKTFLLQLYFKGAGTVHLGRGAAAARRGGAQPAPPTD